MIFLTLMKFLVIFDKYFSYIKKTLEKTDVILYIRQQILEKRKEKKFKKN